jgi:hypothetical protein
LGLGIRSGGDGAERESVIGTALVGAESVAGIVDCGVELDGLCLMAGLRSDVGEAGEEALAELVLDGEVVVVRSRRLEPGWFRERGRRGRLRCGRLGVDRRCASLRRPERWWSGGVDLDDACLNGDGLGGFAKREFDVDGEALVGEEGDILLDEGSEARGGGVDGVVRWAKGGDDVVALIICGNYAGDLGSLVGDGDFGVGDDGTGGVGDGADDGAESLGVGGAD